MNISHEAAAWLAATIPSISKDDLGMLLIRAKQTISHSERRIIRRCELYGMVHPYMRHGGCVLLRK